MATEQSTRAGEERRLTDKRKRKDRVHQRRKPKRKEKLEDKDKLSRDEAVNQKKSGCRWGRGVNGVL